MGLLHSLWKETRYSFIKFRGGGKQPFCHFEWFVEMWLSVTVLIRNIILLYAIYLILQPIFPSQIRDLCNIPKEGR